LRQLRRFYQFFFPALTGIIGFWATLSLNIPDFTRYAKDQRAQILGQALGLPTTMTFFAFIGVAVTSSTLVLYGEAIWDPIILIQKFDNPFCCYTGCHYHPNGNTYDKCGSQCCEPCQ
jgi:NCS1 family nucleobase:cation symporter-1